MESISNEEIKDRRIEFVTKTAWIILPLLAGPSFSRPFSCTFRPGRYYQAIYPLSPTGAATMLRRFILLAILLSVTALRLHAAEAPTETARGDRLRDTYFRAQVKHIADADLADIKTRADWEKKRPEYRRQFLDMLGLWPLPPRTDLHATITGKVETDLFTVEKLHFQSSPGLYVTANLYVPKRAKLPAPAVLYVCGHANTVIDKVSYGSKVNYQHHPAWFAEHGYVCLILDTLELGEIPGDHHGTSRRGMWWWQALGYTPAGIECWNAMRALDYLETRKEVDAKRIGVTGR